MNFRRPEPIMKSKIITKKYFKDGKLLTGFSLIEMLAVIFIISVLSAVIIANFGDIREQLALRRATHQFVQDLRRAQEMAMSSKQAEGCTLPAKGYGIYVDILTDNKSYKLYADTAADDLGEWEYYTLADCVVETINIEEKGVIIKEINNIEGGAQMISINFKPPNPNINIKWLQSDKNEVEIVLALEKNPDKTKTIAVNKAGMIEIK